MPCATLCYHMHGGHLTLGLQAQAPSPAQCSSAPAPVGQHVGMDSETQESLGKAFLYVRPRATVIPGSAGPGCLEDTLWLSALCLKLYSKS